MHNYIYFNYDPSPSIKPAQNFPDMQNGGGISQEQNTGKNLDLGPLIFL